MYCDLPFFKKVFQMLAMWYLPSPDSSGSPVFLLAVQNFASSKKKNQTTRSPDLQLGTLSMEAVFAVLGFSSATLDHISPTQNWRDCPMI